MSPAANYRPVEGILWTFGAGLLFVGVNVLVKFLGPVVPATEMAFLRYALGLVLLVPAIRQIMRLRLTGRQWGLFALRGALHAVGVALWFYAMATIPLADVTAMNYLSPIYVTIGAALFMGEKLAARRIIAVVVGLVGALVILRPGFREISEGHVAMMIAALVFAGSYLLAKHLTDATDPIAVITMLSVWVTVGLIPLAAPVWVTPTWFQIVMLFVTAAFATLGHYLMTLGFRAAPITVTQPVTFLQLVWAVALGVLLFDEPVDPFVILGGLMIIGAISFITWREAVAKKTQVTPPVPPQKMN
ncbi:membrane protein, putative [Pseudooceanicola batsensis HTCC2597]|uniref:Membrane protein, putative n=1 Tax=Pseudooceanicola batsensis (strain ATCC BAA-863 / DSM 15984 / KCTC 12145 / HTCC2597) TaxID=252305 RepID=A3TYS2_PSEBH|nr:DMT family transporter [Pseudooceanicola batsensis]EAQ02740.1 membrane protein, putative [Pseudooceanicola batsensis HTCC2597]